MKNCRPRFRLQNRISKFLKIKHFCKSLVVKIFFPPHQQPESTISHLCSIFTFHTLKLDSVSTHVLLNYCETTDRTNIKLVIINNCPAVSVIAKFVTSQSKTNFYICFSLRRKICFLPKQNRAPNLMTLKNFIFLWCNTTSLLMLDCSISSQYFS